MSRKKKTGAKVAASSESLDAPSSEAEVGPLPVEESVSDVPVEAKIRHLF